MQRFFSIIFFYKDFILKFFVLKFEAHFAKKIQNRDISIDGLKGDYGRFLEIVQPIAIKRVSGTEGNKVVREVKK